jgi:hypothetical protein
MSDTGPRRGGCPRRGAGLVVVQAAGGRLARCVSRGRGAGLAARPQLPAWARGLAQRRARLLGAPAASGAGGRLRHCSDLRGPWGLGCLAAGRGLGERGPRPCPKGRAWRREGACQGAARRGRRHRAAPACVADFAAAAGQPSAKAPAAWARSTGRLGCLCTIRPRPARGHESWLHEERAPQAAWRLARTPSFLLFPGDAKG